MAKRWKRIVNLVVVFVFASSFLAISPNPVAAGAYIQVNTTIDYPTVNNSFCTLRWAIIAANTNARYGGCPAGVPGAVNFIFLPASVNMYILSIPGASEDNSLAGDLDILSSMEISGAGASVSKIYSSNTDRVFHIYNTSNITLRNLEISAGESSSGAGGGIFIQNSKNVTMQSIVVTKNHAASAGGGIALDRNSSAIIDASSISYNTSQQGGGILNEGTLTLKNSIVNNNTGSVANGGIDNNAQGTGYMEMVNTTVAENLSPIAAGVGSYTNITILNSTIVANLGTGLYTGTNAPGWVKNSIIALQSNSGINCAINSPAFASAGHNIENGNACGFTGPGDQTGVAYLGLLVPYSYNGGPTETYALSIDSPAVDAGDDNGCPATDQRLYGRPADGNEDGVGHCDIGSFELGGTYYTVTLPLILH